MDEAKAKLDSLDKISDEAWGDVKERLERCVEVMKRAFESAELHCTQNN